MKVLNSSTPLPGKTATKSDRRRRRNHRIIKALWIIWAAGFAAIFLLFILIYNGIIGYMPDLDQLKNPTDRYATVIYTSDGEEMGRFYRQGNNRVYADYSDISPYVVDALIATEDARFMEHAGIDVQAFARVLFKTVIMRDKSSGGGSTITQQLAKQLYTGQSSGMVDRIFDKPVEWMIALKLERLYSKEEIIKLYLNQFDFLYNAVGIKSAANVYFNKEARDLNIEEAATLVGMVKNPSLYNPVRHPDRTRERRNVVIDQMQRNGKLPGMTQQQVDSLKALPLTLDFHRVDHKDGLAPYFRENLRLMLTAKRPERSNYSSDSDGRQRFYDDSIAWADNPLYGWIEKNPKPDGSKYDIYTDGLRIYSTIDSRMQRYAEEAVHEHMSSLQHRFFAEKRGVKGAPYTSNRSELSEATLQTLIRQGIVNSDRYQMMRRAGMSNTEIDRAFNTPVEMDVFSYNGLIDTIMTPRDSVIYHQHFLRTGFMSLEPQTGYVRAYVGGPDFRFFQYDMAGRGRRQVGSTFKPYLYAYAMENGYTPCDEFLNSQPTLLDENGRPWSPRNSGSANVDQMVTLRWALTNSNNWISARLMNRFDPREVVRFVHNFGVTSHLDPVISLCLGPCDISVREMASAYTAFANRGMRATPVYVTRIEDANGNVISEFSTTHNRVMGDTGYYRILSILLNVVDSGTGNRLRRAPYNLTAQTGGKTGTTNYNADGWFMAFTPQLVSATWVGGENRYIHFNTMANGQGAEMALPIYAKYIKKVYDDPTLPYTQDATFNFPAGINLCAGEEFDDDDEGFGSVIEVDEGFTGAFD